MEMGSLYRGSRNVEKLLALPHLKRGLLESPGIYLLFEQKKKHIITWVGTQECVELAGRAVDQAKIDAQSKDFAATQALLDQLREQPVVYTLPDSQVSDHVCRIKGWSAWDRFGCLNPDGTGDVIKLQQEMTDLLASFKQEFVEFEEVNGETRPLNACIKFRGPSSEAWMLRRALKAIQFQGIEALARFPDFRPPRADETGTTTAAMQGDGNDVAGSYSSGQGDESCQLANATKSYQAWEGMLGKRTHGAAVKSDDDMSISSDDEGYPRRQRARCL